MNSLTIQTNKKNSNTILQNGVLFGLLLTLYGMIRYVIFFDVFLPVNENNLVSNYTFPKFLVFNYLLNAAGLIFKIVFVLVLLNAISIIMDHKIKSSTAFRAILIGEIFLLIEPFMKIVYFSFFQDSYNTNDLTAFAPFSIFQLLGYESGDTVWEILLQSLNLFQLFYFFILGYFISYDEQSQLEFSNGIKIAIIGYGAYFLLWQVMVAFLVGSLFN